MLFLFFLFLSLANSLIISHHNKPLSQKEITVFKLEINDLVNEIRDNFFMDDVSFIYPNVEKILTVSNSIDIMYEITKDRNFLHTSRKLNDLLIYILSDPNLRFHVSKNTYLCMYISILNLSQNLLRVSQNRNDKILSIVQRIDFSSNLLDLENTVYSFDYFIMKSLLRECGRLLGKEKKQRRKKNHGKNLFLHMGKRNFFYYSKILKPNVTEIKNDELFLKSFLKNFNSEKDWHDITKVSNFYWIRNYFYPYKV